MGRRKIDIKPIKDERNRSVTFLKRKGGLFKKAYELSVLCSVDVAVVIFGNNKKLHQFSSRDMREMLQRWTLHGEPNEYKIPADFNGGADDDDDDDENGSSPQGEGVDPQMYPPQFQTQPQFPVIRNHTASASPPIPNGVFGPRGHTPQPQMASRPSSRNDIHRMGANMVGQPVGPPGSQPGAVNGFSRSYMPQTAMYNAQNPHNMPPNMPHGLPQPHPQYSYPQQQPHPHQMQPYVDEQRRASGPATFPHQPPQGQQPGRHSVSPPQPPAQLPPQPVPHMSPPAQAQAHPIQSPPQQHLPPPPPNQQHEVPHIYVPTQESPATEPAPAPAPAPAHAEPKPKQDLVERARQPLLLNTNVKKQPPRKGGSIFTPIEENKSILQQHLAAFSRPEVKSEAPPSSRSQSIDAGSAPKGSNPSSPPSLPRINTQPQQPQIKRNGSLGTIPETVFTPPSRSNSLRVGGSNPRPQLKVRIPDESDGGSATNGSASPRGTTATDITSQPSRRPTDSHSSGVVLPPPSPSASATLLSAGATGPPNPFARPPPHQTIETPVSSLPSRFLGDGLMPSPNPFYAEWGMKGNEHNTLSPLTWSTPVAGMGPSFLREDLPPLKRKSPEPSGNGGDHETSGEALGADAKRVKVDH
ncbi:hypothetical protein MYCTH_2295245 [Thermothelomyces thermophilus ATCC 42464]|uniref:MADS-box domain-containing protein n=1 Tax=Thermothelomyces thermophilus (strain ATCC 42464 / BCRC 31852 / DSM 1799) TaxID=573729 RepID=G2Q435_THET4|nr:uncharacterized protein MYCTH_2295245 [Thermothelomyces thermophilus ATCC 42464]AEO53634.1 hypothetical protein MYCTH_2295245 [Thermothelomyces thermophilus ATCC 42464]